MIDPAPSPWPRRLRRGLILAVFLALPVLWWTSRDFRLVIYELAYPHLSSENQKWAFERIRSGEERPDVAWRCYAEASDDPGQAWSEAFSKCYNKGAFEFRGMEDELIRVLGDPRLSSAHQDALWAAIQCQVKDPRLGPVLVSVLQRPKLACLAAFALTVNGNPEAALPVLIHNLEAPLEGEARAAPRVAPTEVGYALAALRYMGPTGAPAASALRPWAASEDRALEQLALAALWSVQRDPKAAERLKAMIDKAAAGNAEGQRRLATLMAEVGLGDASVRKVLEAQLPTSGSAFHASAAVPILDALGQLGAVGRSSLPILEPFLRHEDPAVRDAARRAMVAIQEGAGP